MLRGGSETEDDGNGNGLRIPDAAPRRRVHRVDAPPHRRPAA